MNLFLVAQLKLKLVHCLKAGLRHSIHFCHIFVTFGTTVDHDCGYTIFAWLIYLDLQDRCVFDYVCA